MQALAEAWEFGESFQAFQLDDGVGLWMQPSSCCVVLGSDNAFDSKLNRRTRSPAAMHRLSGV